jgi:hypothetical protein
VLLAHPRVDRVVRIPGTPAGAALSGTGPTLTFATGFDIVAWHVDDGTQPRVLGPIPREWGSWAATAASPTDDAIVAIGENDGVPWVRMVSVVDGASRLLLVGDQPGGTPVDGAVTPDGLRIVLLMAEPDPAGRSTTRWQVIELDAADGSLGDTGIGGTFPGTPGTLAVDFAQDAGSVVLWDRIGNAATLVDLADGHMSPVTAEATSAGATTAGALGYRALPGGTAARLGADGGIALIDRDGRTSQVLEEHGAPVLDAAVSPDGTWAVSAGEGTDRGEVYRWAVDPATGQWSSPETLAGHSGAVVDVEVDGTGERLVTLALDQTAISWAMGVDAGSSPSTLTAGSSELISAACAMVARDFTPLEWDRYLPERPFSPTCSDML